MNALQVVADVITRWPGLRSREIVERSGYCAGTVQRAISAMRHDGLVRMTGLRYYPVSGAVTVSQAAATYMHYPPQSRTDVQILAALATGPQTQAELRAIVGGPAFAVRDRLRGLVRRGGCAGQCRSGCSNTGGRWQAIADRIAAVICHAIRDPHNRGGRDNRNRGGRDNRNRGGRDPIAIR